MARLRMIDLCLCDFFVGCADPVLAIPVDHNTTAEDFSSSLIEQYNHDELFPEVEGFNALAHQLADDLKQVGDRLFPDISPTAHDDHGPTVHAYVRLDS